MLLAGAVALTSAVTVLINISMFWTLSGAGISMAASAMLFLLGGHVVPLPLWPDWLQPVLTILPLRGIADVPFRFFAGHIPLAGLLPAIAHQAAWMAALVVLGRWLLARAARRIVVQGG